MTTNTIPDQIKHLRVAYTEMTDIEELRENALGMLNLIENVDKMGDLLHEKIRVIKKKADGYREVATSLVTVIEEINSAFDNVFDETPSYKEMIGNARAVLEQ